MRTSFACTPIPPMCWRWTRCTRPTTPGLVRLLLLLAVICLEGTATTAFPSLGFSLEFQAPAHGSHVHNNADLTVVALLSPPPSQLSSVHGPGSAELQFNRTWFRWRLQAVCHNVVNFTQHRGMALLDDSPVGFVQLAPFPNPQQDHGVCSTQQMG